MPGNKIKKLNLLATRRDMDNVLLDLIDLGCVEVSEPDALPDDTEIQDFVSCEVIEIDNLGANIESLVLLGTRHTLLLCGWVPSKSAGDLLSRLSNYLCAWEIVDPLPDERELVPVKLRCPGFFGKFRLAGRKPFRPLRSY